MALLFDELVEPANEPPLLGAWAINKEDDDDGGAVDDDVQGEVLLAQKPSTYVKYFISLYQSITITNLSLSPTSSTYHSQAWNSSQY